MPQVSIITALHNKGPYVGETVCSVVAQSMSDWELIVVENGSTDQGPDVVRTFEDERIRLIASTKRGPGAARNVGIRHALGEWLLFLDADDLIEPEYLQERLQCAASQPGCDIVIGCWEEFADGSPRERSWHKPAAFQGSVLEIEDTAIAYAPWALHAALVRKCRLTPERHWPEELDNLPSEDAAFWFPVVCGASPAWSHEAGALYRIRTQDGRNAVVDVERSVRAVIGVIEYNLLFAKPTCGPNVRQIANVLRVLESNYRMALGKRNRHAAALALRYAQSFLHSSPAGGWSIRVRRLLGLKLFNLLRFGAI